MSQTLPNMHEQVTYQKANNSPIFSLPWYDALLQKVTCFNKNNAQICLQKVSTTTHFVFFGFPHTFATISASHNLSPWPKTWQKSSRKAPPISSREQLHPPRKRTPVIKCPPLKGRPWLKRKPDRPNILQGIFGFSDLCNRPPPPKKIAGLMIRAYDHHWFPLIRPAVFQPWFPEEATWKRGVRVVWPAMINFKSRHWYSLQSVCWSWMIHLGTWI